MNLDLRVIQRTSYTLFDILSDVGGIQGILISGISVLLNIWNYNYLDSYLVSQLFKIAPNPNDLESETPVDITSSKNCSIKEFFIKSVLPRKLVCCRRNRKQLAMNEARKALEKEVDILEIIKSRRFFHIALRHLLKPALHEEFEARSKFFEINTDQQHSSETV